MTDIVAVDLSHWNADPDWQTLKAAGVSAVILKCTEGLKYVDPTFYRRKGSARAAGFAVASYHFLKHGSAAEQMDFYVKSASPSTTERLIIDFEDPGCAGSDLIEAVTELKTYDREVTVYGSPSFLTTKLSNGPTDAFKDTALWLAQYTSNPKPSGWPTAIWPVWSLWQYSQNGTVKGIKGNVDVNRFNGSAQNFLKWMGAAPPVAATPTA